MSCRSLIVIGAGQLGSRHLQALLKLEQPACITVLDPSAQSLATAKSRMQDVPGWDRHQVVFHQDPSGIPAIIDFAVIATAANVRRTILEKLLDQTDVRYLLLEKVLFQRATDCVEIGELLDRKGVKAWVNAPRRMWSCYKVFQAFLSGHTIHSLVYSGSGWGLACNSYHMLDLFAWLTGSRLKHLLSEGIDKNPITAKRSGHFELKGTLWGQFESGATFAISDYIGTACDSFMLIETPSRLLYLSEHNQRISVVAGEPLPPEIGELQLTPEYQSNLTNHVAEQVIKTGNCELASYSEASVLHQRMLRVFETFFSEITSEEGSCPIT